MFNLGTFIFVFNRNSTIHAFGFVGGIVRFFLTKTDDASHVKEYFDKYMKIRTLNMNIHKREPNATVNNFSFEQGSKIDISETSRITKNDKPSYGSLGIFFQNKKKGKLFFTTCAHVVAEGCKAFCPCDHTILGESIFSCEKFSKKSNQWIDLSLVEVCQDKVLHCISGLKGTNASPNFSEYAIFPGSIEDLTRRNVYKWGATTNFTDGTVCDIITPNNHDGFLQIAIQSSNSFAKKGDSGSLICVNITEQDRYAVLVMIGELQSQTDTTDASIYSCYYVSDAVDEIKTTINEGQNIELCPVAEKSIPIYSESNQHVCCSSNFVSRQSRSPTRMERESRKRRKALSPTC